MKLFNFFIPYIDHWRGTTLVISVVYDFMIALSPPPFIDSLVEYLLLYIKYAASNMGSLYLPVGRREVIYATTDVCVLHGYIIYVVNL